MPQFSVEFADAQQDNAKQVSDVENFLTKQIDLLIISPNEATPLTAVVAKAYNKGIPVIVLDRKVDGDAYTTWIGADNVEIGKTAGEYVAEQLLPDGGKVGEIRGLAGATPAKERGDGFREGIEGKNIEIVASSTATGCGRRARRRRTRCSRRTRTSRCCTHTTTRWPRARTSPRRPRARRSR